MKADEKPSEAHRRGAQMETARFSLAAHAARFKTMYACLITAIGIALPALIVTACGDGGGPGQMAQAQDIEQGTLQEKRIYVGTASTKSQFPDSFGRPRIADYAIPVAIEVGPPLVARFSGQQENNPFHFSVNPASAQAVGQEGLFTILSAGISFQGSPTNELLVQYWSFVLNGDSFSGELTQPQNALSLTSNLINLPQDLSGGLVVPFTFGLARGTRLNGTITAEQIVFRVEGNTLDLAHPFVSEVVANRAR
jgi:hypothetical protein